MAKNLSPTRDKYYKQTNNEIDATIACQCTTITAGLDIVHGNVEVLEKLGKYKQPEDNLKNYVDNDPEALNYCIFSHGKNWDEYVNKPSEWADVLVKFTNKVYNKSVIYFDDIITDEEIKTDIDNGLPVAVSMKFVDRKVYGHYVLVVGYNDDGSYIINDPFKNFNENTPDGFNCIYTKEDFKKRFKGYGIRFKR
jgi:hypothetical protein